MKDGLRPITAEQGEQLAKQLNIDAYCECSALTQGGLPEVFDSAARLALAPPSKAETNRKKPRGFSRKVFKRCRLQ